MLSRHSEVRQNYLPQFGSIMRVKKIGQVRVGVAHEGLGLG